MCFVCTSRFWINPSEFQKIWDLEIPDQSRPSRPIPIPTMPWHRQLKAKFPCNWLRGFQFKFKLPIPVSYFPHHHIHPPTSTHRHWLRVFFYFFISFRTTMATHDDGCLWTWRLNLFHYDPPFIFTTPALRVLFRGWQWLRRLTLFNISMVVLHKERFI
jgi:hypothetical protein